MIETSVGKLAIVGGGPAGLMAAETARTAGIEVDVYESKGSVGRKFLLAGKGGLNLTHSENSPDFVRRYGSAQAPVGQWLTQFDANALREWARGLGVETFVGTSGRVFPSDLKAAPLLRTWVRRLRDQGVRFHVHHQCTGLQGDRSLHFETPFGEVIAHPDAVVLAMGGASWPELGSNGEWIAWLQSHGVEIAALAPSNCGFETRWSEIFAQRYAGQPVKSVVIAATDEHGRRKQLQGEFVVTSYGVEGSAIYALSADLRRVIEATGSVEIELDLLPGRDTAALEQTLSQPRNGKTLTEFLRRRCGIDGVKMGLLYEVMDRAAMNDPHLLAATIKALRLKLVKARPVAEAISSAGGVRFVSMNDELMLKSLPGVFCAGEMIDWEAPTGGYLLTACFASGLRAGLAAARWLEQNSAMNTWHALVLGDGIMASVAGEEIRQRFRDRQPPAGALEDAIFIRYDSGELHCEVTAYFSPGAADIARHFGAPACGRPARAGLELLAGSLECWRLLFQG